MFPRRRKALLALVAATNAVLGLGAATRADAAPPATCAFRLSLSALSDGQEVQLSVGVVPRSECAPPRRLKSVEVLAGRQQVAAIDHVPAPAGRAVVDLGALRNRTPLRVAVQLAARGKIRLYNGRAIVRLRPDLVLRAVRAPASALLGRAFTVSAKVAEPTGGVGATAEVVVTQRATALGSTSVHVRPGAPVAVSVPVTPKVVGTLPLTLQITRSTPAETNATNNTAQATVEVSEFGVNRAEVIVPSLTGYGAQLNQNVYAQLSRDGGVSDENVGDMEQKLVALSPGLVRVFFAPAAFASEDLMQSFLRTMQLAQRTGAAINVTFQGGAFDPAKFGALLVDLVKNRGIANLRWVTLQNEVNSTRMTMDAYEQMYRQLDTVLASGGVRQQIRFMGGDLVQAASPLGQTQADWLNFLATRMGDILDAYSIHVFWNYFEAPRFGTRLQGVRAILDALPQSARKPLYVTEYGVRGRRTLNGASYSDPGVWDDATPIEQTAINGFQHAWFDVLGARLGVAGAIKWDGYFGKYDRGVQDYSLIGPPQLGWPLRPVYYSTRLFTETTRPGWKVIGVDGQSGTKLLTAYLGPSGETTIIGLDSSGGTLNAPSANTVSYTIGGLAPSGTLQLVLWNADGTGGLTVAPPVQADAAGVVTVTAPLHSVFALTTLPVV